MNYPSFLNSFNLYVDGKLIMQDTECPSHPRPESASYVRYSEVVLLPILIEKTGRSDWKESKDSKEGMYQQGQRSVFEFINDNGKEAAFFVRSEKSDDLTNIAPPRP